MQIYRYRYKCSYIPLLDTEYLPFFHRQALGKHCVSFIPTFTSVPQWSGNWACPYHPLSSLLPIPLTLVFGYYSWPLPSLLILFLLYTEGLFHSLGVSSSGVTCSGIYVVKINLKKSLEYGYGFLYADHIDISDIYKGTK